MNFLLSFFILSCSLISLCSCDYSFYFQPPNEISEEKAFEKLSIFEKKFQETVENVIKKVLPYFMRFGYEANITKECTSTLLKLLLDLKDLKTWAFLMCIIPEEERSRKIMRGIYARKVMGRIWGGLTLHVLHVLRAIYHDQVLDATGKPEGGFMSGTVGSLGNYKQCIDIVEILDTVKIRGKYCLVDIKPPLPPKPLQLMLKQPIFTNQNSTFKSQLMTDISLWLFAFYDFSVRFGVCVPSTCSKEDINEILNKITESFQLKTGVLSCEVKEEPTLDNIQYGVIATVLSILGLNLCCTIACIVILKTKKLEAKQNGLAMKLMTAFSIPNNFLKSINTDRRKDNTLEYLDGLRFISMTWVVLGHAYSVLNHYLLRNLLSVESIVSDILFEAISSGFLAVDTFIFIGGLVLAYGVISKTKGNRTPFKAKEAIVLIICRILRIWPGMLLMIGLTLVMPLIGSGPMWKDFTEGIANNCRKSWWANIFFINNYYNNLYDMCLSHTWYLSVDFQCLVFGIIYLLIFFKKPRISIIYTAIIIGICTFISGFVTYYFNYPPTILIKKSVFLDYRYGIQYMALSYISTHVHLGVYCIGLLTGTLIARSPKIKLNKVTVYLCWSIVVISGLSLVYGIHHWNEDVPYSPFEAILFSCVQRLAWAVILFWICFACLTGNAGFVNRLLSWPGFRPLAQLSFFVYLMHYLVIICYVASGQGLSDYSHSRFVFIFFGLLCISHIIAFVLNVLVESPLIQVTQIVYAIWFKSENQKEKVDKSIGSLSNGKVPNENISFNTVTNLVPVNLDLNQSQAQVTRF